MALGPGSRRSKGRVTALTIDQALKALAGNKHVILVGATEPIAFFAYPGKPNLLAPTDATIHVLARLEQDLPHALRLLADELGAPPLPASAPQFGKIDENPHGKVTSEGVAQILAALLPEDSVVVEESVSFGRAFFPSTHQAAPHDWLQITGGAIGSGLPMAVGAAIGAPGRRIISLEADGSAMYTLQALWTQARERLDVTTVLLNNRKYAILISELTNVGANPGRTALDMLDLGNPDLGWIKLAQGLGIEAASADSLERFADLFGQANRRKGPFLIELQI